MSKRRQPAWWAALSVIVLLVAGCGALRGGGNEEEKGVVTAGVTKEACPFAVNKKHGCIYLGVISDLTVGPFAALAVPITNAQKAFWQRVNEQGGIGDYDIDVQAYVRDNKYDPAVHNQVYQEIKGSILALAQSLGSSQTAAILDELKSTSTVAAPASWTSAWEFEDVILESGSNYCFESMNAVDYAVDKYAPKKVMAVHYAGDYGADAAAGAKVAAQAHELSFTAVETGQGADNQGGALDAIAKQKPDLVILTTGPTDAATIVGQSAARGFKGRFIGTGPSWNVALLKSPAAPAFKALYEQSAQGYPFDHDSPGFAAMRQAIGNVAPSDGYVAGWVWSYPMKAALQKMVQSKDISRKGLLAAVKTLTSVDYEGMLSSEAGNYSGDPSQSAYRATLINKVDDAAPTGVSLVQDFTVGPTAKSFNLTAPCFTQL